MSQNKTREQRVTELHEYLTAYSARLIAIRLKMDRKGSDNRQLRDELMLASDAAIELAKMALDISPQISQQFYALALEMMNLSLEASKDHAPRPDEFTIPGTAKTPDNARL